MKLFIEYHSYFYTPTFAIFVSYFLKKRISLKRRCTNKTTYANSKIISLRCVLYFFLQVVKGYGLLNLNDHTKILSNFGRDFYLFEFFISNTWTKNDLSNRKVPFTCLFNFIKFIYDEIVICFRTGNGNI